MMLPFPSMGQQKLLDTESHQLVCRNKLSPFEP